jgi:hypothetical protein
VICSLGLASPCRVCVGVPPADHVAGVERADLNLNDQSLASGPTLMMPSLGPHFPACVSPTAGYVSVFHLPTTSLVSSVPISTLMINHWL